MKLTYRRRFIWGNVAVGLIAGGMALFLFLNQKKLDFPVIVATLLAVNGFGIAFRRIRQGYLVIENDVIRDTWIRPTRIRLSDVVDVRKNIRHNYVISTRTGHLTIGLAMMDDESRKKLIRIFRELGFDLVG